MAIEDTVNTIITDAQLYSSTLFTEATDLVDAAVRVSDNLPSFSTPSLNFNPSPTYSEISATAPADPELSFELPEAVPEAPDFQQVVLPDLPVIPDAPEAINTSALFKQVVPAFDIGELGVDAPVVRTEFDLPDLGPVNLPAAPEFGEVNTPDAPNVTLPRFTEDFVETDPGTPEDLRATYEEAYARMHPQMRDFVEDQLVRLKTQYAPEYDAALAQIEAKISNELDNGVLGNAIEQQIFDRARTRIEAERQSGYERVEQDVKGRGFPIPPGLLHGALVKLEAEALRAAVAAAAETAIERTKIEIQHGQFLLNLSSQMRQQMLGQMIQYAGTMLQANGQALQYAKELVESAAQAYNLLVKHLEARVSAFKIKGEIYELQLRSALADLEVYRIEMEAAKLKKDFEQMDVQVFEAKIRGEAQKVQTYLAQLQAVSTEADIEKTKVELYGEQVRAFAVRVGAKESEFKAYAAAVGGDESRVKAYATEVEAYRAQVQGVSAVADLNRTHAQTTLEANKNLTEQFRAELAKYGVDLDSSKATLTAGVEVLRANVQRYQAELQGQVQKRASELSTDELALRAASQTHEAQVRVALARAGLNSDSIKLTTATTLEAAKVLQNTALAALGSQNTMVQLYAEQQSS